MPNPSYILLFLFLLMFPVRHSFAFQQTIIRGTVRDTAGHPVEKAIIAVESLKAFTYTDSNGRYSLTVQKNGNEITLTCSFVGCKNEKMTVKCNRDFIDQDFILHIAEGALDEVTVRAERPPSGITLTRIPVREIRNFPSASGSFEAIIKTFPGVASANEMSSQYSVRGGNYDENLVYINDIEIFRPFLVRSGQQEGLSVINPDLVSSVAFSSGGFSALYGDRMSSVMDIKYKTPASFSGSVSMGLLLSSAHIGLTSKDRKLTWLAGVRYKSSRLMLKTLDSKGDYQPVFSDIQSLISYSTGKNSTLTLLVTWASNKYNFIPQSRTSTFGSASEAYQLYMLLTGREKDLYSTWNTDVSWSLINNRLCSKISLSTFTTNESESFDIRGYYNLGSLDKIQGSENFSDSVMNIGIGSYLTHARNRLSAYITSLKYRGETTLGTTRIAWGAKARYALFSDRIKEWTMTDSSGYSLPYNPGSLKVSALVSSSNDLSNLQADAFGEVTWKVYLSGKEVNLNAGLRGYFNSFTREFIVTPRLSAKIKTGHKTSLWLAGGGYYQPPFYREMRFPDGSLNNEIRSQRSVHAVAGATHDFEAGGRPFRLTAEGYYKILSDIILYKLDNVRLIYTGENTADGYSTGIDLRLNGEFVPGTESWISLSLMDSKLKSDVIDDMFPSPSEQTFMMNIFFQDYIPGNPSWRAHINISFATGLPVVSPFNNRYDQYHRLPSYRRVDLGITKVIKGKDSILPPGRFPGTFKEVIAGIEIFNLLDINNTVSYFWVKAVNNLSGEQRQYAVPNYLTGRSFNFRLSATF